MNADRANAYGHLTTLVVDLGGAELHGDEQAVLRDAADALVFAQDARDAEPRDALDRVHELVDDLVDADRLTPETAAALITAVEACGPSPERAAPAGAR